MKTLFTISITELASLSANELALLRIMPETDLDPAQVKPGMTTGDHLARSLVLPSYRGGPSDCQLKPGLRGADGYLKRGMLDRYGNLKPSARKLVQS